MQTSRALQRWKDANTMENNLSNNSNTDPKTPTLSKVDSETVDKSSEKRAKGYILSDETFRALTDLGDILRSIHQDMIDEGYEFVDGTIQKKIDKI